MNASPRIEPFAKVARHIGKLVDVRTNKCLSCNFQLKSGGEIGHYKVEHFYVLKEIAKQIDAEPNEGRITLQEPNNGSDSSSAALTKPPQVSTPSNSRGTSDVGLPQCPVATSANFTPRARPVKRELLPRDEDDDVIVMSTRLPHLSS